MTQWPHAPAHYLEEPGAYMVTAGTYLKRHFFLQPERLTLLQDTLLEQAELFGWKMQAWSCMSNHYHFVSMSPSDPSTLRPLIARVHSITTVALNKMDNTPGREVWYQFWDKKITFQKSYLARLNYVHHNPVKHKIVADAEKYPWCSAAWFRRTADDAFYKTVCSFKTDKLNVLDDY